MSSSVPSRPDAPEPSVGMGRAFRHRDYRLFFGGMAVSLVGMWIQLTALGWLVFRLTDSAALVGFLTLAMQAPSLFLGPIAGAIADRHDKRLLLVAAQLTAFFPALALGLLTVTGRVEPWHILSLAFIAGLARAFEIPTRQALVPRLVAPGDVPNAIALNSALFNGARIVGPAIAGALIPLVGEGWCFLINSVCFLGVVVALLLIRPEDRRRAARAKTTLFAEIREGVAYVRRQPAMLGLLGCLTVLSAAGMPYGVLLPSFAERQLAGGAGDYALLQIAVAIGCLAAALRLAVRRGVLGLERIIVGAGIGFGVVLMLFSQASSMALAFPLLVVLGAFFMLQMASSNTLMQTLAPDELRGRVMSLHTTLFLGLFPFAGLVAGTLADRVGERPVLLGCGAIVALGAAWFGRGLRRHAPDAVAAAEARQEQSLEGDQETEIRGGIANREARIPAKASLLASSSGTAATD